MSVYSAHPYAIPDPGGELLRIELVSAHRGASIRLIVAGELDRLAAAQLSRAVGDALRLAPATMEIDASGITFLDAGGIRCLLICRERVETAACAFLIIDPAPAVTQVLQIAGLLDILGIPAPTPRASGQRPPALPRAGTSRRPSSVLGADQAAAATTAMAEGSASPEHTTG